MHLTKQIATHCFNNKLILATAESCTGGLISATLTELPGSSLWFDRGFVTYSNLAKEEMLGVDTQLIDDFGAVSEQVARAMALGAILHSSATISLAVTGIAGPSGGSAEKPVGTVWFAWANSLGEVTTALHLLSGDRHHIRKQACELALLGILNTL